MPLFLSLSVHAIPVLLFLILGGGGDSNSDKVNGLIIPKVSDSQTEVEISKSGTEKSKPKHANQKCPTYFGGIGITHDSMNFSVLTVYEGYPAYEAGIKKGDTIITPVNDIRGEVGTELVFEYISYETGDYVRTVIIRDKICTQLYP